MERRNVKITTFANQPSKASVSGNLMSVQKDVVPPNETYHQALQRIFPLGKNYSLIKEIGKGSYGLVISATERHSNLGVAIKKITNVF